ncbi:MAG: hypothetical protein ACRCV9_18390 [Burkholderiaceae bacterium]
METTTLNLFYIMLALTVCIVLLPLTYMRKITRQVLLELCDRNGTGAEFWLRTADVLAIAGSLILVLIFGRPTADAIEAVRMTLIMALAGVFITVMFVASNIWRQATRAAGRALESLPEPNNAKAEV